jgi:hypothetical protein
VAKIAGLAHISEKLITSELTKINGKSTKALTLKLLTVFT